AFSLLQCRRAQQQAAWPRPASDCPAPRRLTELSVLPNPPDVDLQRRGKVIGARLELGGIVKEDEIQPGERLGNGTAVHPPANNRREALVQRRSVIDFFQGLTGRHRVRG